MLRDTQGVAPTHAVLPVDLVPIVARFTGAHTCEEIARLASKEVGERIPLDLVVRLATELEDGLFVDGAPYRRARVRIEREFADADVRPASHAGGAYHGEPAKLAAYIQKECFGRTNGSTGGGKSDGRLLGLIAPHIDPWRGARCYGEAYGVLGKALPDDADTFILFGTSHAPMREPFALCRKAFETPLGRMEADKESIDAIAGACDFDPYADQFNHKREHSLEFQAVFLRHLLGTREARIIPILAGLGEQQSNGKSPSDTRAVEKFLSAVRKVVDAKRAVVIAGADLAHVGPRFGDPKPFDEGERQALHETDRESLDHATRGDAEGFWKHVAGDLETRRVCGLAPIYSLLRTIAKGSRGHLRHYEQTVDPDEGSIVSHAALGFHG
jgi:AmmeMemoRadiSam system protein B